MPTFLKIKENLPLREGKFSAQKKSIAQQDLRTVQDLTHEPCNKPLTRKQKLAVEYFVSGRAKTMPTAARMAGYSAWSAAAAAYDVFAKPNVRKELQRRERKLFEGFELTSQDIINKLILMAEANLSDYIEVQADGTPKVNLNGLSREQIGLIESLEYDALGRPKIKLPSRRACLMDIAKLKGIGTEVAHTTEGQLTIQVLDQLVASNTQINIYSNSSETPKPKEISQVIEAQVIEAQVIEDQAIEDQAIEENISK